MLDPQQPFRREGSEHRLRGGWGAARRSGVILPGEYRLRDGRAKERMIGHERRARRKGRRLVANLSRRGRRSRSRARAGSDVRARQLGRVRVRIPVNRSEGPPSESGQLLLRFTASSGDGFQARFGAAHMPEWWMRYSPPLFRAGSGSRRAPRAQRRSPRTSTRIRGPGDARPSMRSRSPRPSRPTQAASRKSFRTARRTPRRPTSSFAASTT